MARDPDRTRERLLEAGFHEIHRYGFQAANLDTIVTNAGVTKGALYHHFPNKKALGYGVVDGVIRKMTVDRWLRPLEGVDDPIDTLLGVLSDLESHAPPEACQLGCPLNNLAQEMSPIDEGFRERLEEIFRIWRDGLAAALRRGQEQGRVRADIDVAKAAAFVVAVIEGAWGMSKSRQSLEVLQICREGLARYLETLRGPARQRKAKGAS